MRPLLVLWLAGLLLAGCASPPPGPSGGSAASEAGSGPADSGSGPARATTRIAVVLPSSRQDMSWSQSLMDSLARMQKADPGIQVSVSEQMVNVADAANAMRDYADDGCDLIVAHGAQYGNAMFEVAGDYPEVSFAWGTATDTGVSQGLKNVFAYEARAEQGGYLNGLLAARLSKTGVLGIIGPVQAGDARLYIDGFQTGARAANPKVKLLVTYTGSFSDTALASEAANVQLQAHADVLTGSAQQVVGAISLARQKGVWWMGTQTDQSSLAPDRVVACQVFDWTGPLQDMLAERKQGRPGGKAYRLTLESGLTMVYNRSVKIPESVQKELEDARTLLGSGKLKIE